jgi:hypothetical protein
MSTWKLGKSESILSDREVLSGVGSTAVERTLPVWTGRQTLDYSSSELLYLSRDESSEAGGIIWSESHRNTSNTARRSAFTTSVSLSMTCRVALKT